MDETKIQQTIEAYAKSLHFIPRSPIIHTPSEYSLPYEEVFFPSYDGVPLEGWFIPSPTSPKRLIIANHPMGFSRAGFPSHIEPWKSAFGEPNHIEILHEAGYNVHAYDLRNFGQSGAASAGSPSGGRFEARDVVGSLIFARKHPVMKDMDIALFSRFLGCNASLFAMHRYPEFFADGNVKCMVSPQPVSPRAIMERNFERDGIPLTSMADLDRLLRILTSFGLDDMVAVEWVKSVKVPTFLYQVRDDTMTKNEDVQAIFDSIPVEDKELLWIRGTTRRWDGYNYFQKEPKPMLDCFEKHMK